MAKNAKIVMKTSRAVFGTITGEVTLELFDTKEGWTGKKIMEGVASESLEILSPDENGVGLIQDSDGDGVSCFRLVWSGDPVAFDAFDFGAIIR